MRLLLATTAVLLLTFSAGAAMPVRTIASNQKVAASGQPLVLARISSISPNCASVGSSSVQLLGRPAHGQFAVQQIRAQGRYPAGNPRSKCNGRKLPMQQLTYVSTPGYQGPDVVQFQIVYPNGTADRVRIPLLVK